MIFSTAGLVALVALSLGITAAGAAGNAKVITFTAQYSGKATAKVTDNVADISASGTGKAALIGAGKVSGTAKGDTSAQPCVPFTGPGTMTGTSGTIAFKVIAGSSACGDEQGNVFSVSGKASVVKATGKLAKAKGTLKITGVYDRGAGTFTVKFSGKLTQ